VTIARQRLGHEAETLVAAELSRQGMVVIERNTRFAEPRGELDLVALDDETLVFVEVKALRPGSRLGPERPALAVDRRKQLRLRALARAWLAARGGALPRYAAIRFDVVGLRLEPGGQVVEWDHIRAAF
jgi:putative endonuclease